MVDFEYAIRHIVPNIFTAFLYKFLYKIFLKQKKV